MTILYRSQGLGNVVRAKVVVSHFIESISGLLFGSARLGFTSTLRRVAAAASLETVPIDAVEPSAPPVRVLVARAASPKVDIAEAG